MTRMLGRLSALSRSGCMFKSCVLAVEARLGSLCITMGLYTGKYFGLFRPGHKTSFKQVCTQVVPYVLQVSGVGFLSVSNLFYTLYTGLINTKTIQLNKGLII